MFGIKYTVHEPLSTVLNQVAEGSYQAVASLLWKLKRAEHSLSAAWLSLNGMQRIIGQPLPLPSSTTSSCQVRLVSHSASLVPPYPDIGRTSFCMLQAMCM